MTNDKATGQMKQTGAVEQVATPRLTREEIEQWHATHRLAYGHSDFVDALVNAALESLVSAAPPEGMVEVPVEKLRRYELMFEVAAVTGIEAHYADGTKTPNAQICRECSDEIEAMIAARPVAAPLREALNLTCVWLRSALDCKQFHWDVDQWNAADETERAARALLEGNNEH